MKREIAIKWLRALDSDEYQKHYEALRKESKKGGKEKGPKTMCCLGVLCDLYRKEVGQGRWVLKTGEFYVGEQISRSDLEELPTIRQWAGLKKEMAHKLALINDEKSARSGEDGWDEVRRYIRKIAKVRKDEV